MWKGFITACSKFQLQGLTVQAMQPKVSELQDHPIATIAGWPYMNMYALIYTVYRYMDTPIARTNHWDGRSRKVWTCLRHTYHICIHVQRLIVIHCANIGESESHDGVRHVLLVRWCVGTAIWLLSCSFDIAADRQFKHHRICTGLVPQPSSTATQHLTWGIQNHGLLAALPSLHSDAYTDVPVSAHLPEAPGLPVTTKSMFTDVHSGCHMFRHCPLQITLTTSIIPLTLAPDPRWCLQPTIPAQGCPLFLEAPEAPGLKRPTQGAGKPPSMIQQAKSHKFHWALCASDRCSFRNASVQKDFFQSFMVTKLPPWRSMLHSGLGNG